MKTVALIHPKEKTSLVPLILIGAALFAGPAMLISNDLDWYDQQRIIQILLLGAVAAGAPTLWRQDITQGVALLPRWATQSIAAAFGLGLVSTFLATYPRFAGLEWATFWLLSGLAVLLAAHASRTKVFDTWGMWVVVAVCAMIALKVIVAYWVVLFVVPPLNTALLFDGVVANRRFFGQMASLVIPLLAFPLLRANLRKTAYFALFGLLAVWWMLAIASGTRGTWAALGGASLVLAVAAWRGSAAWLRVQAMTSAVGAALFIGFFVGIPSWYGGHTVIENRLSNISTLSARDELWATAWTQIQAHPWLGLGPMHLAAIPLTHGAHPHNAVLQLAAEWGIVAAFGFVFPVAIGILRLLVTLRQTATPNLLRVSLTASLLAGAAQSMVDGMIVVPYTQIWLVLVSGWTLGEYFRRDSEGIAAGQGSRPFRVAMRGLFIFALFGLLNGAFPDAFYRTEVTKAFMDEGHELITPRYWFVGRIP